ncbi:hypothetical protein BS50DRAFT_586123 [Corynespora cassiicola Philippines]|uniref:Uncharacterized protein n=1 Tax=Corynespora cassiicola Philippines TaxID=1448308 RepID=A0A2T2NTH1_CORCC|nr:hypothetical protein BS50DRAFT_586123 [Corynespora cassiicola Philippines]
MLDTNWLRSPAISTVQDGYICERFYLLNPLIDAQCFSLWMGMAYCVQTVGNINTYPSYPYSSSAIYTLNKSVYTTTTSVLTPMVPTPTSILALLRVSGKKSDYEDYADHVPAEPFQDQSEAENVLGFTKLQGCQLSYAS